MDIEVIRAKQDSIARCIGRIQSKPVGFRNTAVHAYQQIDWTIVHKITHERLNDFSTFVREIDQYIDKTEQTEKPAD